MLRLVLCALVAGACASPGPTPTTPKAPPPEPTAAEPVATPAASTAAKPDKPPELPSAPAPTEPGWDFHAWAYDRGLKVELTSDGCEPAQLGDKPDETVWCAHHVEGAEGGVLYTRALYAARNKRLVKLVEIPVAAGVVDNPQKPRDEKDRQAIRFEITRAADGKSVRLGPARGFECEDAMKGNTEPGALGAKLATYISRVCATRGPWKWGGGTLRQDR